jgi:hypothetical protein
MSSPTDIKKHKEYQFFPIKIYVHAEWCAEFMAVFINGVILKLHRISLDFESARFFFLESVVRVDWF